MSFAQLADAFRPIVVVPVYLADMINDQNELQMPVDIRTLKRVKDILRRDLVLGKDIEILDDTALIDGDFDFDSLDMLLLVTSIEKEFAVKISDKSIGQKAFASVTSLARFIDENRPSQSNV